MATAIRTKKIQTLCIVHDDERILLGMKKRGFGAGKWNGFGGKVEEGESTEEAARREVQEEAGIILGECRKRAVLMFEFEDSSEQMEVHVFSSSEFTGVPTESEEMLPKWYLKTEIPYEKMWVDDKFWLPLLLAGKDLEGSFKFGNESTIIDHNLKEV